MEKRSGHATLNVYLLEWFLLLKHISKRKVKIVKQFDSVWLLHQYMRRLIQTKDGFMCREQYRSSNPEELCFGYINNKAVLSVASVFTSKQGKQSFTVKLTHSMHHSFPCFSHISHTHMQETLNIYTQTYHMFLLWHQMQDKSLPL